MNSKQVLKWSPHWAMHVEGYFEPRTEDMDPEEPQKIDIVCLVCRQHHRAYCFTGKVDRRISFFALLHRECWVRAVP